MRVRKILRPLALTGVICLAAGGLAGAGVAYEATIAPTELIETASAHTADIQITKVVCLASGDYEGTVELDPKNVPNGVTTDVVSHLGSSTFSNGWGYNTFAPNWTLQANDVPSTTNKVTWTVTFPGNTVGNGPWVYAYSTYSDNATPTKSDVQATNLKGDCTGTTPNTATAKLDSSIAACVQGSNTHTDNSADLSGSTGVTFTYELPDGTTGPLSAGHFTPTAGTITVYAHAPTAPAENFTDGSTLLNLGTKVFPDPASLDCRVSSKPVTPTVIQAKCVAGLVTPGSAPTFAELVALQPAGVVATLNAGSTTEGTFAADADHYLTAGSATTFSLKLDPLSAVDCAVADASAKYTVEPATCYVGETLKYGSPDAINSTWNASSTVSGTVGPANFSLTADGNPGHKFNATDLSATFTGALAGPAKSVNGLICGLAMTGVEGFDAWLYQNWQYVATGAMLMIVVVLMFLIPWTRKNIMRPLVMRPLFRLYRLVWRGRGQHAAI